MQDFLRLAAYGAFKGGEKSSDTTFRTVRGTPIMLEICLPAGGLWGISLTGALLALKERGLVPNVVTGVSSGAHAAYLVYSGADRQTMVAWFEDARRHMSSQKVKRFLPPYDSDGLDLQALIKPYTVQSKIFTQQGISKFFVGYTKLPYFSFEMEDILSGCHHEGALTILKSSTIPFCTHFGFHIGGAIDGGFRRPLFNAPANEPKRRILLSYSGPYGKLLQAFGGPYDDVIQIKPSFARPLNASTVALRKGLDEGYQQGLTYKLSSKITAASRKPK